jgi:hypothetical protein
MSHWYLKKNILASWQRKWIKRGIMDSGGLCRKPSFYLEMILPELKNVE